MNSIVNNKKGAALVVTLAIVAILVAAALQLGKSTGESVMATLKEKDLFQAQQFAVSGIELARLILSEDAAKNNIDSIQEVWADSDILIQAVKEMGLDQSKLTIKITDELSKIQVNALLNKFPGNQLNIDQADIWEKFLYARFSSDKINDNMVDKADPVAIINCVKDWLDSIDDDATTGLSGAESDYYLGLEPSYVCANAPFNHIDELFNVKGISKDFLKQDDGKDFDKEESELILKDIFTVYGLEQEGLEDGSYRYGGKININTAGVDILKALLPTGMEDLALDLVDFRSLKSEEGDTFINPLDKGWYKKVIDLSEKEQKNFERVISYSSNIFKVECTGRENSAEIKLMAWLQREKNKESGKWMCRIIQMER
ncbi:MAG: general secretion pathway protein GspK [Desulfobacula sp.]|nr:general secretion pathway protein GspK [Desulfobacula sp.]